jgi:hypothetical protein
MAPSTTTPLTPTAAATAVDATAISDTAAINTVLNQASAATLIGAATALSPTNPSVTTPTPTATVTVPNTSGSVTFQLIVTDNLGVQSAPATFTVNIQGAPTAVLTATPNPVAAGKPITLSGAGSKADGTGTIASFAFSLLTSAPAK